jgi:GAF domain-containing protein
MFRVCWSFGIDLENYDLQKALGDADIQRMMRGDCHVAFGAGSGSSIRADARAFVPIRVATQTVAILAIFSLLPQKLAFDDSDMELFKLLSTEAAQPLFMKGIDSTRLALGVE